LDFTGAKFVVDLGASKRSTAGSTGTFRMGIFYQINDGPLIPYSDGRDFDISTANGDPNISALNSIDSSNSLLDPNNSGSLARTIDNDYNMLSSLSVELGSTLSGLSQGDSVTFHLTGVTNRNGTAYNLLVDNLGIAGLTASNSSVELDEFSWTGGINTGWNSVSFTFTGGVFSDYESNWDFPDHIQNDSIESVIPGKNNLTVFPDLAANKATRLRGDRIIAGLRIDSQSRYSFDQSSEIADHTLFLDGDLSVLNSDNPTDTAAHNSYCNINLLSDSSWDIAENQEFTLFAELQGYSNLIKKGKGRIYLFMNLLENLTSSSFSGNVNFQEGVIVARFEQFSNSIISFTESSNPDASRNIFLDGIDPTVAGLSGPHDGTITLAEYNQTLSLGSDLTSERALIIVILVTLTLTC